MMKWSVITLNEIRPLNEIILSFNVELHANVTLNERIIHLMLTLKQSQH